MKFVRSYSEQVDGTIRVRKSSGELGILVLLGVLGLFTVVYSQLELPIENPFGAGVGPRLFPQLAGAVMILMSVYLIVQYLWRRRRGTLNDEVIEMRYRDMIRVAAICFLAVAYMLTFNTVGFLITTTAVLFTSFVVLGFQRYVLGFVLAIAFTLAIYLGFTGGLGLPLPDPILGELLGGYI